MKNKIRTADELVDILSELKEDGKKIVSTSGCFDILHAGHVQYLEAARAKGDILVLLLNTDESVRRLKGLERPIVNESERAIVAAGLESVDYVCLFNESTPCEVLSKLKPDAFIKGGDYEGKHIPEMDILSEYGGQVEYVLMVDQCSTTNIVEKIKRLK